MFGLRGQELLIVLLIVLIIFGARKLPDLARSIGASAKEFRKGIEEGAEDAETSSEEPPKPESPTTDRPSGDT